MSNFVARGFGGARSDREQLPMWMAHVPGQHYDVYADELGEDAVLTLTRARPAGRTGRIDAALIGPAAHASPATFICDTNGFAEAASTLALEAGAEPAHIRTERFGPTG